MDHANYCPQPSPMEQLRAFSHVFFAGMMTMAVIWLVASMEKD